MVGHTRSKRIATIEIVIITGSEEMIFIAIRYPEADDMRFVGVQG
jgi:hypothetical protein